MPAPQAKEIKVHYKKTTSLWITLGIVCFLAICSLLQVSFFTAMENKAIDFRFKVRGVRKPQAPVMVLAIDEKSLKEVGQWPWPRSTHAQIIRKLKAAGAKCVFYDVLFSEAERTQEKMLTQLETVLNSSMQGTSKSVKSVREKVISDVRRFQQSQSGDQELATAMKEAGNVFFLIEPFTSHGKEGGRMPNPDSLHMTPAELIVEDIPLELLNEDIMKSDSLLLSIPELQKNVEDAGHTRCFPFSDGIYRYYPTVISYQGRLIPHISIQVARYLTGKTDPAKIHLGKYAEVAGRKIPILRDGSALINFCGPEGTIPTLSVTDVLHDRIGPDVLKGMAVEIGATATGLNDLRPTPFSHNAPGVELNSTIVENIVAGNFLHQGGEIPKYLLMVLLGLLVWYFTPRLTPIQGTIGFLILFVGYFAASCAFFTWLNTIIFLVYPLSTMTITFLILTTYKFRTEVRHSRYMKQMFQSMVTPKVVDEILKLPSGIELGGEEKELTVMFSDIRSFTTFSERHTPHEVVEVLNEYLTQMTYLVFQTEGTLDKYIGDAIMAFWGAPASQPDNAYRACSTALGMVDLLHSVLHPKWLLEGKEKLEIGIGLNTGPMVVGFVGSQSIKSYTLIGDAVNLGSRLEGTTKEYHVEIIIAESTYAHVKNDMLCRELDLIKVKGKNEPIRIYELVDHRLKGAGTKEMKVKAFEEGLALYRAQKWDEAASRFKNCLELDPHDGPAEIFQERCKQLKKNPPEANWDGVFVMKTK